MANESDSLITKQQLQADLETFYNTYVKPYLNGATGAIEDSSTAANKTWSSNKINNYVPEYYYPYSTTEKAVGKWTDNKTVYEKVLTGTVPNCSTMGTSVYSYISIGANISSVVSLHIFAKSSSNIYMPINNVAIDTSQSGISKQVHILSAVVFPNNSSDTTNKNKIRISNNNTSWNGYSITCIIRYTKA